VIPAQERLGATYLGDGRTRFVVWAPAAEQVEVLLLSPEARPHPMERGERGYFRAVLEDVEPGASYLYRLDGERDRPDPASRFQPQDVHGPSQVVSGEFAWGDECWFGIPLDRYILYELHVGAFTPEGTFDALIPHLSHLKDLGITAVEIMPVAQFPGSRNWGYDGVFPFAVQASYGGPGGLKRLVNACHQQGLAVVLDVVYNHLGPEGNYLWDFGPYFTDRYRTPWGSAINFDGPESDEVRRFFLENVLYWITEFHIDALRLDAVHAIYDRSAVPFLQELAGLVRETATTLNRRIYAIAESDLNDSRLIRSPALGGYGLDAQWCDDFHHALHTLLTGERSGYYADYGSLSHLAKSFRDGYVYSGEYSCHRMRRHGNSTEGCEGKQFVVFSKNHDQIGNRMLGDRPSQQVGFEGLKLAAGAVILSPFIPLLFMGEEYGEIAPFQYFISHLDDDLVEAVRQGRRDEFASFQWIGEPADPQAESTFLAAKLSHELREGGEHRVLLDFHRELIRLRTEIPALSNLSMKQMEVREMVKGQALWVRRWHRGSQALLALNFDEADVAMSVPLSAGRWKRAMDSAETRWKGKGSGLPAEVESSGEVDLVLRSKSVVLLHLGENG
jgi:maltooligosyltrehalose trehalohydrolase